MVPGETINAGPIRGVFDHHQLEGHLRKGRWGSVGPVIVTPEEPRERQEGGLCVRAGEAGDSISKTADNVSDGGIRAGDRKDVVEGAGEVAPGSGREGSDQSRAITIPVKGVVPLLDERGDFGRVASGRREVKEPGDVGEGRWRLLYEEQVPRGVLAEVGEGREGRAVPGATEVDVCVAEESGTLGAGGGAGNKVSHK